MVQNTKYRFIFLGSLLGIKMKEISSIPIGFLTILQMYPMDFEEFSKIIGISKDTLNYLEECFINQNKIDEIVHKQM
ncbi:AAA family ATPase [Metamycoplasma equirhinis]|uniref:AAA family ATPase n=1 Tax=Metamycoplasma equirhinis TaxID=92402 RepID=A0ABZ0PAD6_9BACT|nr:AAA family ATPase [Metamycoplasma equirhinis]WPB53835.1 AAA family ATPase [Metamycoplasma equirhinis]